MLADAVAAVAGAVGEESVCFAEGVAAEGRRRCSWGTAARAGERSGYSLAVGSQARTEVEGNRGRIVEEESRGRLAEVVGTKLFCEHHATRHRALW